MFKKKCFIFKIYLCIVFGYTGSSLLHRLFLYSWRSGTASSCGVWASYCSGLSCCKAQDQGHVGFSSCISQALEHRLNSRGTWFSCFTACGIFPYQRSNPCLLHRQVDSLCLSCHRNTKYFISKVIFNSI